MLFLLFLFVSGCGDSRAPLDATVTGPEDSTFEVSGGGTHIVRPGDFQVKNKQDIALPDIEVELFAGGGGILTDLDGNPLDAANPTYFKTTTDDRGLARASFQIALPDCTTKDVTIDGSILASVGVTSKLWKVSYTIKTCPT